MSSTTTSPQSDPSSVLSSPPPSSTSLSHADRLHARPLSPVNEVSARCPSQPPVVLLASSPASALPLDYALADSSPSAETTLPLTSHDPRPHPNASLYVLADISIQQRAKSDDQNDNTDELLADLSTDQLESQPALSPRLSSIETSSGREQGSEPPKKKSRFSAESPYQRPSSLTSSPKDKETRGQAKPARGRPLSSVKSKKLLELTTLPIYEELCDAAGKLPLDLCIQTQQSKCASLPPHLRAYRCAPCISKQVGSVCAFRYIRSWIRRCGAPSSADPIGGPLFPLTNDTQVQLTYRHPIFPTGFNRLPRPVELIQLRHTISRILQPILVQERAWYNDPNVRFIGRRIELLTRCDYCSATLIGSACMCQNCGKEACLRCFEILKELSRSEPVPDILSAHKHPDWLRQITSCTKWRGSLHGHETHIKISHLTKDEVVGLLTEMEFENEIDPEILTTTTTPTPIITDLDCYLFQPEGGTSEPYYKIPINKLEENPGLFDLLWSQGQVIVVTGVKDRFRLPWTPDYLRRKYSDEPCMMLDSNSPHNPALSTTVSKFFEMFEPSQAKKRDRVWKLRDWPPESDFKRKFPDLFNDFQRAIPIGDITNRGGIRNIAAHFPLNANIPDIGPKMYIAMQNSDQSGSQGSTVLHMDVADAINVQTYAQTDQGEEGCALWHLYHADHAPQLRNFLHAHHANKFGLSLDDVVRKFDDPIHTTRTYIDADMRKRLKDEFGVKGWEIRQLPGEAIFIPAYTAHQVCNLANCIKVAADFVSPQSIERCLKLKEEFRGQNAEHRKPWRDDILQFEQMLL